MVIGKGFRTHSKGKHVRQWTRSIVDDVKLAGLEEHVPDSCTFAESFASVVRIVRQRDRIQASQYRPDY
jgi:hypothetical protein